MFPLISHYLSAVEDRIAGEVIPNIDAWVEAAGDVGGDVDVARAARKLQWRLDQLYSRLDALQHPARVIDRPGWSEQECRSSASATNDLSHRPAFRDGIPGRPVRASQPTNSAVASLAANRAGDFAPLTDDSHGSFHAMHRQIATTGHGAPEGHQVLPSQQSFQGPDESMIQPISCQEGVGACDQIPLPGSATFLFPQHSTLDLGTTCADTSLGCTELSLTVCPLNRLELPLSSHRSNPNGSVPNSIQSPEMEKPAFLTNEDVISAPAEGQAVVGNNRCVKQRTRNCNTPAGANGAGSGHDFGMMKIQSAALGARRSGRTPIEIDSGSESEATSESSASDDQDLTLPGVDPHLLRLVDKANASCNLPEGTLRCFLPGRWLNDINITETIRMLAPETAEPLIAEHAIQNYPEGGLAQPYTPADVQNTALRHKRDSTHLIIAYNVPSGSLNCTKNDRKNHWVLIIVSVLTHEIHIFGTETGLQDQAEALAKNIGLFVNNHRSSFDGHCLLLEWSTPTLEPLYPFGIIPDGHNCGIAVISRTEAFFHPEKALNVQQNTTPFGLAHELNQKRSEYLRLFIDRYKALNTTKRLYDQITMPTIIPAMRTAMDVPFIGPSEKTAERSHRWLSNCITPQFLLEPRISRPELWRGCIMACAKSKGFNAEGVFLTFQNAPEHDIQDVLRVLQCICEVANPEKLVMFKRLLNQGHTETFLIQSPFTPSDADTLWKLHCLVRKFTAVDPPILIFKSLFCLLCFYECHESAVSSRRKALNLGRADRKLRRDRERGRNRPQASPKQDLNRPRRTAEQQVRASLVERFREAGNSLEVAKEEIRKSLQHGKKLKLLLHGRNPLWLLLTLIQADGSSVLQGNKSPPALNLMEFNPPTQWRKLSEPISTTELLEVTERLAVWFGESLFTARPELKGIDLTDLDIFGNTCNQIRLCSTPDEEIHGTGPNDIAKLFH